MLRYNFFELLFKNEFDFKNEMIVFSDEDRFSFRFENHKWWVKDDDISETPTTKMRKYPFSTLIWTAIGHNYKSKLIFIDKSFNEYRYKQLLKNSKIFKELNEKKQKRQYFSLQDGTTCHQTPMVINYLNRMTRVLNGRGVFFVPKIYQKPKMSYVKQPLLFLTLFIVTC